MQLSEHTQDLVEGLAGDTPPKPAPQKPDPASALFGLGFAFAACAVLASSYVETRIPAFDAVTRVACVWWILVTVAWLMFTHRRAIRRVQATVLSQQRDLVAELRLLRSAVGLRVESAREDGYADGFVAGTSASNGRSTIRAIREAGP